ncbi:MAG: RNA polymerase sigma factor [Prevotella sp.]|nr:RNA polymerase sigma factor [Prevotella sp.]
MDDGEKILFERAAEEYSDMVTGLCLLRLGSRHDAEDCCQNVFLKLFKNSGMLSRDPEYLKAWLIRVTVNECKNFLRFRARHKTEQLDFIGAYYEDGHERLIMERIMSMKPIYREVLYLHCFCGYPLKELSKLLGCGENTLKSRLKRGREMLRDLLDG